MIRLLPILALLLTLSSLQAQNNVSIQYFRLEGSIGKSPIVLHLHRISRMDAFEPDAPPFMYYTGNYYYTKYGAPIRFDGQLDSSGALVLSEMVGWNVTGVFRLNPNYQGSWTSGDSTRTLPVVLRESYPQGAVAFQGMARNQEITMEAARKPSPAMTISAFWLEPTGGTPALQAFLMKENIGQLIPENEPGKAAKGASDMSAAFQLAMEQYTDLFKSDMSSLGMEIDSTMPESMFHYDFEFQTEVLFNDPGLLSIGFTHYGYTGGAHGNYATTVVSYNLTNLKRIELKDVLKPGHDNELQTALNQAARKRAGLLPGEGLGGTYFVDDIPATENFYLTNKGLVFSYPPYEIASYADGQVELFVPFASVGDWLQKPWKK